MNYADAANSEEQEKICLKMKNTMYYCKDSYEVVPTDKWKEHKIFQEKRDKLVLSKIDEIIRKSN